MTGFQNLHTHTTYCDGVLPPEDMIKAAINKGCTSIGFSEHSYVPFDIYYSMSLDKSREYISELRALREKYDGVIEVLIGLERDYYTDLIPEGLEYMIGTLHYVSSGGQYVSVDAGAKHQKQLVDDCFGGDFYSMAEEYFSVFANVVKKTNADIVGHFDLVAKYKEAV
jgi:histidinol-phosphatase (PHP family)